MNPAEHTELKRQVDELLDIEFIRELKLMCGSHTFGAKEGWHMTHFYG